MLRQIRSITRLDYNISTFSGLSSSQVHRLQSILNASVRLFFRVSRFTSVTPLLQKLDWLPIKNRVLYRLAILVFLCRQNRAPSYLTEDLSDAATNARRPNMRSSYNRRVTQPRTRHPTLGGRSFTAAASRCWNSLSTSVRFIDNLCVFKKQLKAHLLEMSFT